MGQAGQIDQIAHEFAALPRPPHVSSSIAEQVLARITSGDLPVGARLPGEVALARDFGVSRPSVREALAALQFAGYVESRRGYGTVVVSTEPSSGPPTARRPRLLRTLRDAVDLLETRLVLEPHALATAATDPDRSSLRTARVLIDGMHLAADQPELQATTDIRVHRALLGACRNAILRDSAAELLGLSLDPLLSTARTQAWSSPELPHTWAEQHAAVHDAIAAADPVAARAGSLAHLASVLHNLAAAAADQPRLAARLQTLRERFALPEAPPRQPSD